MYIPPAERPYVDCSVWWHFIFGVGVTCLFSFSWVYQNLCLENKQNKVPRFFYGLNAGLEPTAKNAMKIKNLFLTILLLIFSVTYLHAVNVVFRYDDPRLKMDSVNMRVVQLFNTMEIPLSIAVVPCDKEEYPILPSKEDSLYITELHSKNIEITLHGLTHQNINSQGEFGGLDSLESIHRIASGKATLENILRKEITTFIPPFNAYNTFTEEAMRINSFSVLSADKYNKATNKKIQYFPETLGHMIKQKGIWIAAREAIMDCYEPNAICVIMFHAYDLPNEEAWIELEKLLVDCKNSSKVDLHTFQSLLNSGVEANRIRYRANQLESGLQKYFLHSGVLHTTWLCIFVHLLNALCLSILPLIILLFRNRIHSHYRAKSLIWLTCFCSVMIFILASLHLLGPIKLFALSLRITLIMILLLFSSSYK